MSSRCSTCERRDLDTIATLMSAASFILAYQIGTKKLVGCRSCARNSIFKEDGNARGIGGDQTDSSASAAGAVYVY
jgi:hypothetical protein